MGIMIMISYAKSVNELPVYKDFFIKEFVVFENEIFQNTRNQTTEKTLLFVKPCCLKTCIWSSGSLPHLPPE